MRKRTQTSGCAASATSGESRTEISWSLPTRATRRARCRLSKKSQYGVSCKRHQRPAGREDVYSRHFYACGPSSRALARRTWIKAFKDLKAVVSLDFCNETDRTASIASAAVVIETGADEGHGVRVVFIICRRRPIVADIADSGTIAVARSGKSAN